MATETAPPASGAKTDKPLKILIYRIGQFGDTLIALPSLWAIRRAFPDAHLTYLESFHPGRGFVQSQAVLPRTGLIDEWFNYAVHGSAGGVRRWFGLWKSIRARHFDMLVYLAPRLRPRKSVWRDMLFFRSAGIRHIVGHKGFRPVARVPGQPLPLEQHETDHLLERLKRSQIPIPANPRDSMDLVLTAEEKQTAEDWLRANVPGYPNSVSLVGLGPGSKAPAKVWPAERFAELGSRLIREQSLFPIIFGGPEDATLGKQLIQQWGSGACAAGVLAIRPAAAALARCRLFVGNDTGTLHLAVAAGLSCVGIYAAQDWPGRWYPYGPGHIVLRRAVPCEGCRLQVCIEEGMRCLKEIGVEEVWQACQSILQRPKGS